jgi:rhodanese-related sulfurtransferase
MSMTLPPVLTPAALASLVREHPETRLLDVRTPAEFEAEHIASAYNVPLDLLGEHGAEIRAAVAEPVVLICRSGQRARKAEQALKATGMSNLHVLDGGMLAWTAAGHPGRSGAPRMSLERQVRIVAGVVAAAGGFLALFVNPLFAALPALVGAGLAIAGATDNCLLGLLLARLPFNRRASCDVPTMVRALTSGASPHDARPARAADLPRAV